MVEKGDKKQIPDIISQLLDILIEAEVLKRKEKHTQVVEGNGHE